MSWQDVCSCVALFIYLFYLYGDVERVGEHLFVRETRKVPASSESHFEKNALFRFVISFAKVLWYSVG